MTTTKTKTCSKCWKVHPNTAEFFGHTPSGGLRNTCRECKRAYEREQHSKKPEQTYVRRERYNENLRNAVGDYSEFDVVIIRKKLSDKCFYCGNSLNGGGEKDHIIPLSKGGSNWPENITLACMRCNKDKYDKSLEDFISWRKKHGLITSETCLEYLAFLNKKLKT